MKHTISVLVENKPGVLARIAGLFSARGYNICSLAVGETEDSSISRMTIVAEAADERILEQIIKQLRKLIDTITVVDLTRKGFVERELALVKVCYDKSSYKKICTLVRKYKGKIVKHRVNCAIIEMCATCGDVEDFLKNIKAFGITELMRTGKVAISTID